MLERLKGLLGASEEGHAAPMPKRDGAVVIDVRSEGEFAAMALHGALNLPLGRLEQQIRELVADHATPLVLYCASGARSGVACTMLRQMGYADVRNAGGLFEAAAQLRSGLR